MTIIYDRDKAKRDRLARKRARCRYHLKVEGDSNPLSVHYTKLAAHIRILLKVMDDVTWGGRRYSYQIIDTRGEHGNH